MKRRLNRIECLEKRNLLAAGLLPVDVSVPVQAMTNDGLEVNGTAAVKFNAMILDPELNGPEDVSLTDVAISSSGQLSGTVGGQTLDGTFSTTSPTTELLVTAGAQPSTLKIQSIEPDHIDGSFDATVSGQAIQDAVFQAILDSELNVANGNYSGTFSVDLSGTLMGSPFSESLNATFNESTALTADFPDSSLNSVSGRVFLDSDGDGVRETTDIAVTGVTAVLLDGGTEVDSVQVDSEGYYSFYNLASGSYQVRFDGISSDLEFVPVSVGGDATFDSDVEPSTGATAVLDFGTDNALLNVDAGLRTTASLGAMDTVGLYQPDISLFHLNDSNSSDGSVDYANFGPDGDAGWIALAGDWDGDGVDTIGLYQPDISLFHLKNSLSSGAADIYVSFGPSGDAGWKPLVGDWDGDGTDTIGLYQPDVSLFHLKNNFDSSGTADIYARFGPDGDAGWTPLAGDWDGDGTDTIGLYQPGQSLFHLKNSFSGPSADLFVAFGAAGSGWTPITGDWDGDGDDTIGLYDPVDSEFHLKDSFTSGDADHLFRFGPDGDAGWMPLTGDWDGVDLGLAASASAEGESPVVEVLAQEQSRRASLAVSTHTATSKDDDVSGSIDHAWAMF